MSQDPVLIVEDSSVVSDLIRDLLEATGFTVVQASTSRDAEALLEERHFSAVIVEADMPGTNGHDLLLDIRTHPDYGSTPSLLLVSPGTDEQSIEGMTKNDFLHKPIDPVELITRIRGVVSGTAGASIAVTTTPVPVAPVEQVADPVPTVKPSRTPGVGKIITVFSLKGGVGTSTIAVNLAVALQLMYQESTALVDLSLESGALNILLDIMPTATVDELASLNGNMTAEAVLQYLVPHKSGVSLLSAPPSPERAELIDGAALRKAVMFLKEQFDYVVIDTASSFAEHTLMALEIADHIVLPMVGDISSVRATTTAMDIFQALSIPDDRVVLVFNELFPKMGLSRKHAETSMNLTMTPLPYGGSRLLDSINLGDPIVHSDPGNPFSQAIEALAAEVSHPGGEVKNHEKSGGLFGGMRKLVKA
jgi:pilus assembly protein CpaE